MVRPLSFLRVLLATVTLCLVAVGCSSVGTADGGAAERSDDTGAAVDEAGATSAESEHHHADDGHDHVHVEPAPATEVIADGTDDSSVLSDPNGDFDDEHIDVVIEDCAGGIDAACGQLGGRLAEFDSLTVADQRLAICTAGPMLGTGGNGHTASVLTLSIAFADDEPSVIEPIEGIRTGAFEGDVLDGAVASTLAHVAAYCSETA